MRNTEYRAACSLESICPDIFCAGLRNHGTISITLQMRHRGIKGVLRTVKKKNFLELKIPPPAVFTIFAGFMWLLSFALPAAGFRLAAREIIAAGTASVGLCFAAPAIVSFLRAKTTLHPENPEKTTRLVVTGVYSVTRNPMYVSLLIVLIGWAVYLSNVAALIPLPFFVAYLNRFQIIPEERALAALFGSDFAAYCKRVRRWL